ncbi:non-structural polyprotein [Bastrovirus/VietNam/Rat/16715_58]|nr:non-structural polyprotein [Bastrovirus/VietNam/Rat/16715_58]
MDLSFSAAHRGPWEAQHTACFGGAVARRVRDALHIPYVLNREEKDFILKVLRCDVVFEDRIAHTHPVVRALHAFANHHAYRHCEGAIDIGGDFRNIKRRAVHVCGLVDNARDELRLQRAIVDNRPNLAGYCIHGVENCQERAERGISVHSAYDITWRQWLQAFDNHGLRVVDVWLLEPEELFGRTTPPIYGIQMHKMADRWVMLLDDACAGYTHADFEWRKYREMGGTIGTHFNIGCSPEGGWGPLRRYTLFRCVHPLRQITLRHPVDRNLVHVPTPAGQVIPCPRTVWQNLLSWACSRADNKFDFSSLLAYARALRQRLVVGGQTVQEGWTQDPRQVHELCVACFVMAAAMRYTRTQNIAVAFAELRREQQRGGFERWVDEVKDKLGLTRVGVVRFLEKDLHRLRELDDKADILTHYLPAVYQAPEEEIADTPPQETPAAPPDTHEQDCMNDYRFCLEATAASAGEFAAIAQEAIDNLPDQLRPLCPARIFVQGPPGSGKSTAFADWSAGKKNQCLVVVPTRKQVADWTARGFHACTTMSAFKAVDAYRRVIIDEVTLQHAGAVQFLARVPGLEKVYALGDLHQIDFTDFQGTGFRADLKRLYADWSRTTLTETHRCPQDVVQLLKPIYGWTGTSKVEKSIIKGVCNRGAQHLCFSQATKALLATRGLEALTVHEAQGSTFRAVCVHVEAVDAPLVRTSRAHTVVAITRHTGSLVIVENGTIALSERLEELKAQLLTEPTLTEAEVPEDTVPVAVHATAGADEPPNTGATLADMGTTFGACSGIERVTKENFPEPANKTVLCLSEGYSECQTARIGFTDVVQEACRQSRPQDRGAQVAALLDRVCARNNNVGARLARQRAAAMFTAFRQWCDDQPAILEQEPALRTAECLRAAAEKDPELRQYFKEHSVRDLITCKNHLKAQAKFAGNVLVKAKAGQGINAWSKQANLAIGPFIRAAQEVLLRCLKPNVCMVLYQSERQLAEWINAQDLEVPCVCNDFTEFDSTQNDTTAHFEAKVLRWLGTPDSVCQLYLALRAAARIESTMLCVDAPYARMSGESNTLFGNTIVTMAVNALLLPGNFSWAAFKGDDSIVANPEHEAPVEGVEQLTGMICKVEKPETPEFVGFVISDRAYPDLKRAVGKLLGKGYPNDPIARADLMRSVQERLWLIPKDRQHQCCLTNAARHTVEYAEAVNWLCALKNAAAELPQPCLKHCLEVRINNPVE